MSCCQRHPPIIVGHVFPQFSISEVRVDFPDSWNPARLSEIEVSPTNPPWMPNSWPGSGKTDFSLQPWAFWNCFKWCLYGPRYSCYSLFVLFIAEPTVGWGVGEEWVLFAKYWLTIWGEKTYTLRMQDSKPGFWHAPPKLNIQFRLGIFNSRQYPCL